MTALLFWAVSVWVGSLTSRGWIPRPQLIDDRSPDVSPDSHADIRQASNEASMLDVVVEDVAEVAGQAGQQIVEAPVVADVAHNDCPDGTGAEDCSPRCVGLLARHRPLRVQRTTDSRSTDSTSLSRSDARKAAGSARGVAHRQLRIKQGRCAVFARALVPQGALNVFQLSLGHARVSGRVRVDQADPEHEPEDAQTATEVEHRRPAVRGTRTANR